MNDRSFGPHTLLADILDHAEARAILRRTLPGVVNSPLLIPLRRRTLGKITAPTRTASGNPGQHCLLSHFPAVRAELNEHPETRA